MTGDLRAEERNEVFPDALLLFEEIANQVSKHVGGVQTVRVSSAYSLALNEALSGQVR